MVRLVANSCTPFLYWLYVLYITVENKSTTSEMMSAVVSYDGYEQLKTEVERCYATLAQLNSALLNVPKQFIQQMVPVT